MQLQVGEQEQGGRTLCAAGLEGNVLPGCQGCQTGNGPKR